MKRAEMEALIAWRFPEGSDESLQTAKLVSDLQDALAELLKESRRRGKGESPKEPHE